MRRRALLAASGGKNLPPIPDGLFPLYLIHDQKVNAAGSIYYIFYPSEIGATVWQIAYEYAKAVNALVGNEYILNPEVYGIHVYLDGHLITEFRITENGGGQIILGNSFNGTIMSDGYMDYN